MAQVVALGQWTVTLSLGVPECGGPPALLIVCSSSNAASGGDAKSGRLRVEAKEEDSVAMVAVRHRGAESGDGTTDDHADGRWRGGSGEERKRKRSLTDHDDDGVVGGKAKVELSGGRHGREPLSDKLEPHCTKRPRAGPKDDVAGNVSSASGHRRVSDDAEGEGEAEGGEDERGPDCFGLLPVEVQEEIFVLLPMHQLLQLSTVCQAWHWVLSQNDSLWHRLHRRHFGPVPPLNPNAPVVRYTPGLLRRSSTSLQETCSDWRNRCVAVLKGLHDLRSASDLVRANERERHRLALEREQRLFRRRIYQWAAMRNYVWLIREWLTEKRDAEDDAEFMQEALVQAAKNGAKETVEQLFTLGIGLYGETSFLKEAFMFACVGGHRGVVELFLRHSIKFDEGLIKAAQQGAADVVSLLLDHGVPVNVRDASGRTPLMLAAKDNNVAVSQMLLAAGADTRAKDNQGITPLTHAAISSARERKDVRAVAAHVPPGYGESLDGMAPTVKSSRGREDVRHRLCKRDLHKSSGGLTRFQAVHTKRQVMRLSGQLSTSSGMSSSIVLSFFS